MQLAVAVAAVLIALLRVLVISSELSEPWSHGTGVVSGLAWAAGLCVAGGVLLVAVVMALWESFRRPEVAYDGNPTTSVRK